MGIQLGSNFTVNTALPLDDRILVADITARNAILAGRRYEGMIVYVESDLTNYQLVGGILDANWTELSGSGGAGGINFITNGGAEETTPTDGWVRYALTEAVTFTDAGDLVTLTAHGLSTGNIVSFSVITSTTGIVINTSYFVIFSSANTFQLASTLANALSGTALALTTNGSGTMRRANPVTGTGGTPTNLLFSDSVSEGASVLAGTNSFNLSRAISTAAMGEGVSYDFTIDPVYKSRVLTIKFDYIWDSGGVAGTSTTDGSFTVWIYDVTNSVLIQPSSYKLFSNSTTTSDQFQAEFQTSNNSTSYRLIIHNAESTAAGLSFVFDNVSVAPNEYVFGSPVSDWAPYTPAFTGLGTVTNASGFFRRVGDKMEIRYSVVSGTTSGAIVSISLPSGYSIDSSKLRITNNTTAASGDFVGLMVSAQAGANTENVLVTAPGTSTTVIYSGNQDGTSVNKLIPTAGTSVATSATQLMGNASIPISGWSSSVQMADQTSTRIVSFSATKSGNQAVTANVTNIQWTANILDTHAAWNGTDTYTVPVPGDYLFGAASTSSADTSIFIYVNGTSQQLNVRSTSVQAGAQISYLRNLKTGDLITWRASDSVTINGGNASFQRIFAQRISGPSQIASSELVAAKYTTTAATAITNSIASVTYGTKEFDTHNSMSGSTYTAPISGIYEVSGAIQLASNNWTTGTLNLQLYVDGVANSQIAFFTQGTGSGGTSTIGAMGSCMVALNSGQALTFRASQSQTASINLSGSAILNFIQIKRLGNRG